MARAFVSASTEYLSASQSVLTARPLSVSCWFYPTAEADGQLVALSDGTAAHQSFFLSASGASTNDVQWVSHQTGWSIASSSATYTLNTWNHAAGVETTATDRAAYLNGGNKGTNATSRTPTGIDNVSVGAMLESSVQNLYDGAIAEVGIWSVALTDAEIAVLGTGVSPLAVRPASLVFYFPLIRDEDRDLIQGLSVTPTGTPTVDPHPRIYYSGMPRVASAAGAAATATQSIFRSGIFRSPILSGGIS